MTRNAQTHGVDPILVVRSAPFRVGYNAALRGLPLEPDTFGGEWVTIKRDRAGRRLILMAQPTYEKGRQVALELRARGLAPYPLTAREPKRTWEALVPFYRDVNRSLRRQDQEGV